MEIADRMFVMNRDWDPIYLRELITQDFCDFWDLWHTTFCNMELMKAAERVDRHAPVMEDICLDATTLCQAVKKF